MATWQMKLPKNLLGQDEIQRDSLLECLRLIYNGGTFGLS